MSAPTLHDILHILRNPHGWSQEAIRAAQLKACDLLEAAAPVPARECPDGSCPTVWAADGSASVNASPKEADALLRRAEQIRQREVAETERLRASPPHAAAAMGDKHGPAPQEPEPPELREQQRRAERLIREIQRQECDAFKRPHAAAEPEKPMDDDLPGMLAVAKGVAEQKWPHTMDAAIWAREWIARTKDHPDVATDESAMIGWFANAIMAGYDTAQSRAGSYKRGWKDCVKAHDGLYPPHAEFQSPAETPLYASPSAQPIAREPTQLMIQAAIDEDLKRAKTHQPVTDYGGIWRAMYDSALKSAGKEST